MKKVLVLLVLVVVAWYFLSEPPRSSPKSGVPRIKKPESEPVPKTASLRSDLSPEIKPFSVSLPVSEVSWSSPRVSELSEEEKQLRKDQEEADYEWLLRNKTIAEWHQEKKLTDGEYQVLRSVVN